MADDLIERLIDAANALVVSADDAGWTLNTAMMDEKIEAVKVAIAALREPTASPASGEPTARVCPYCHGKGTDVDYVGPEMRPYFTTCSHCNGEGIDPDAALRAQPTSPSGVPSDAAVEERAACVRLCEDVKGRERMLAAKHYAEPDERKHWHGEAVAEELAAAIRARPAIDRPLDSMTPEAKSWATEEGLKLAERQPLARKQDAGSANGSGTRTTKEVQP